MKEHVKDMFAQVTMPEESEKKIRQALEAKRKPRRSFMPNWARAAAAAAAMLALVLLISPTARAAVSEWVKTYVFPDSGITVYQKRNDEGNLVEIVAVDTETAAFAHMENRRLYFTANGENLDITDQIAEDAPFYYTFVDDYELTHYMAVGYSGTLENFGIYNFVREELTGEWVTGSGRNFMDPETETRYPWVDIIWDHWDIPWPMPGE